MHNNSLQILLLTWIHPLHAVRPERIGVVVNSRRAILMEVVASPSRICDHYMGMACCEHRQQRQQSRERVHDGGANASLQQPTEQRVCVYLDSTNDTHVAEVFAKKQTDADSEASSKDCMRRPGLFEELTGLGEGEAELRSRMKQETRLAGLEAPGPTSCAPAVAGFQGRTKIAHPSTVAITPRRAGGHGLAWLAIENGS